MYGMLLTIPLASFGRLLSFFWLHALWLGEKDHVSIWRISEELSFSDVQAQTDKEDVPRINAQTALLFYRD